MRVPVYLQFISEASPTRKGVYTHGLTIHYAEGTKSAGMRTRTWESVSAEGGRQIGPVLAALFELVEQHLPSIAESLENAEPSDDQLG